MKRKIVVADRDESLQYAFTTIFSKEHYQIFYASNGREVEKIAEKMRPDIYIVNANQPKINGVAVYKRLQKQKLLDGASFFFLKDENDTTQLAGYGADGVIEKPINFFKIYETITKEEDVIDLTDVVEEEKEKQKRQIREVLMNDIEALGRSRKEGSFVPLAKRRIETRDEGEAREAAQRQQKTANGDSRGTDGDEELTKEEINAFGDRLGERLRDVAGSMTEVSAIKATETSNAALENADESRLELEARFKGVLREVMDEAAAKLSLQFAPILAQYMEDYMKGMLLEIAEKVIRDEIDKLLKESKG
jgi:response regulator RpfG family c-di-GMP phosphodiesterase